MGEEADIEEEEDNPGTISHPPVASPPTVRSKRTKAA